MSINATLEVDFLGQCASEYLGSHYWSSSGASPTSRGALCSPSTASRLSCCTRRRPTSRSPASSPNCIPAPRLQHPQEDQKADRHRPPEVPRRVEASNQRDGLHVKPAKQSEILSHVLNNLCPGMIPSEFRLTTIQHASGVRLVALITCLVDIIENCEN